LYTISENSNNGGKNYIRVINYGKIKRKTIVILGDIGYELECKFRDVQFKCFITRLGHFPRKM